MKNVKKAQVKKPSATKPTTKRTTTKKSANTQKKPVTKNNLPVKKEANKTSNKGKYVKKINPEETEWLAPDDWTIRDNTARKKGEKDEGSHPSLAVGKNGKKIANFGITHDRKRGHHSNIPLSQNPNPKDKEQAYLRDDLQYHDEKHLKQVLAGYRKLPPEDQEKVLKIINKKRQSKK